MSNDMIILSGESGSAYGDTLQIALGKTNNTTSSNVAHVSNFNNPHNVTLAQLGAAPLNSPAFTGFPTAPQPALNDLSAALATTAYVKNQGYLTANQTITLTGDASGSGTTAITLTLAGTGVSAGTYSTVSVDAKGRVLIGTNPPTSITTTGDLTASGTFLVGGAATLSLVLPQVGTSGTYNQVVTDAKGRVTSGTAIAYLTANQVVTVTGDASGSGSTMIALALAPSGVTAGTYSTIVVDAKGRALTGSNPFTALAASGDATGSASFVVGSSGALALALAPVGTAGTYNQVVTDAKGRVVNGASVAYLSANQSIAISGDASGSGTTAISLTLATVATPGTYNSVVVDAKGRITAGTYLSYAFGNQSILITGDATGTGATAIVLTLAASGVTAGTYTKVTVDLKGRVTSGASLLSADITTALGFTPVSTALVGAASGLATLDATGHLTMAQVPTALVGGLNFQSLWNASTNQPPLASGTGTKGFLYRVSVAGSTNLDGITQWFVGDDAVFDGSVWSKMDGLASEVLSVAGRTGAVVLAVADITGAAPLASPAFTGTPTGPTPAVGDSSTTLATTAFVKAQGYVTGNQPIAISGDATGTGSTAIVLTLASVGVAGTYTQVVTDAKGRITSGSAVAFLTANQSVAISGDATGTGSSAIALTLAASGVTPGTYSILSVDAKGRAVSGTSPQTLVAATGDVTATGSFLLGGTLALALLLPAVGTGGTFTQVVADAKGRVTGGTNPLSTIALSGDATGSSSFLVGSAASLAVALAPVGTAGTYNQVVTDAKGRVTNGAAVAYLTANQSITASGDVSGTGSTSLVLTLTSVGAAGTYNSVATDIKGRVISGTSLAYLLANQPVTISGDASGTGATAITLTLAASGVVAGTYTALVVDAKGRATAGSNPSSTISASGDATGSASFTVGGTAALALTLASVGAAGTYTQVSSDSKGRVISGANPTTTLALSGDASAAGSFLVGGAGTLAMTLASAGTPGTYTQVTSDAKGRVVAGTNPSTTLALSGDATATGSFLVGGTGTLSVALTSVGLAGTYNQVTTDLKGRVIAGASQPYLTANQSVTISGDATGTGSTAIALTLAASGVAAGTYSMLAVDAKGRATAGSNPSTTVAASGDAAGTASFLIGGTAVLALTLSAVGAAGTYTQVVTDAKGRVTSGTLQPVLLANTAISVASVASSGNVVAGNVVIGPTITATQWANQGALLGWNYSGSGGETDLFSSKGLGAGGFNFYNTASTGSAVPVLLAAINGSGQFSATGINSTPIGAFTPSTGAFSTLTSNGTAVLTTLVATGDATGTSSGSSIALTLAPVGTAGTYSQVATDSKGRVISGSNLATTITVSGDASGSGSSIVGGTASIALALASSGVAAGSYVNASITVDAKGRVTSAVANPALSITATAPLAVSSSLSAYTLSLSASGVVAGTYALATLVLDSFGRATSASAGSIVATAPLALATAGGTTTLSLVAAPVLPAITITGTPTSANFTTPGAVIGYNISGSNYETDFITSKGSGVGGFRFCNVASSGSMVVTTLAAISYTGQFSATAIINTPIGNSGPSTGAFTSLTSNGTAVLTALSATGDAIGVSNGTSIALTLASYGAVGTYSQVTTDAKGRVQYGGNPSSLVSLGGDISGYGTFTVGNSLSITTALASVGTAGTYNFVTTDANGRVTSGSTVAYLTGNQSIAVTGDASGSGSTAVVLTLASVGTAGTFAKVVVDGKGRVISSAALASSDVTGALGYTPANLASPNFTGVPLAPTPAQFDNSTKIATTAWVQNRGASFNAWTNFTTSGTISLGQIGGFILLPLANTAGLTLTMPLANTTLGGSTITISNAATYVSSIVTQGSDSFGTTTTISMQQYDKLTLISDGSGYWRVTSYTNYALGTQRILNNLSVGGASTLAGSLTVGGGMTVSGSTSMGIATASTAALLDNTTRVATTSFVAMSGLGFSPTAFSFAASSTLSSTTSGAIVYTTGSATITLTLPLSTTMLAGDVIAFQSTGTGVVSIVVQGSDVLDEIVTLAPNDHIGLTTNGAGAWHTVWHNIFHNGNLAIPGALSVAGSTLLGVATGVTVATSDSSTSLATSAFVKAQGYLSVNQSIVVSGDAAGTGSTAIALTLASSGVVAGTYSQVTVDAKGRVTAGVVMPARAYDFYAANFDSPNTADWKVNALAAATSDPTNTAITVRSFSNTTEQGVGFMIAIPTGVSQVTFRYRVRSATAPSAASTATFNIYSRAMPSGAAVPSWSAATALTAVTIPTNAYYIAAVQILTLATLGWSAGNTYQVEMTRAASGVAYSVYMQQLTLEIW